MNEPNSDCNTDLNQAMMQIDGNHDHSPEDNIW